MIELAVGISFLFTLWVFGRSLIIACSADGCDWLAMPIGLCLVGLTGNLLYFGAGLTVQMIQLLFLCALFLCLVIVLRRGIQRSDWIRLLAVCGIFLVLAIPAYIGGEQYYVFRGNDLDHFYYIIQSLTIRDNPYISYQNVSASKFFAKDVLVQGIPYLSNRPAVGLVFALILPAGLGNIHLLAFLYVTALWALAFPAACFAWKRILEAYGLSVGKPLLIVPPLAYVVGFWGQYIFDINAWSQMASLSLLLAFVFTYLRLLQKLVGAPMRANSQFITSDYIVAGLLAAGAFLFYPEDTVIHALLLLVTTISWYAVARKIPRLTDVVSLAVFSVAVLLLPSLPHWEGTMGWVIGQIKFGTGPDPGWWRYFDSYWAGLHGNISNLLSVPNVPTQVGYISVFANLILASIGMFFVTPDYSMTFWPRYGWIAITVILAALAIYSLIRPFIRLRVNTTSVFLKAFFLSGVLFLLYFFEKGSLWSLGKGLSFLSPYVFLVLCLGLIEAGKKPEIASAWSSAFGDKMIRRFVIILITSQIAFGAARIWAASDPFGIGYDRSTYPSVPSNPMKTEFLWDMEPRVYSHCKGVHLYNDTNRIYREYMKQKLFYLGVPYFSLMPIMDQDDNELGWQQPIATDCNVVFMWESHGKWHAEFNPSFDGTIDFAHRNPLISFVGISNPEAWGSWTDGERALIILPQPLPDRFMLELEIMNVFGENAGKPFRIRAGGQERIITFTEPGKYLMAFQNVKDASGFEILVPAPASPQSLGIANDARALGLALKHIRILPLANFH